MEILTVKNIETLKNKTIKWEAPAARENMPYTGIAKIIGVENSCIVAETVEGDDLSFAFLDKTMQGKLLSDNWCFSDDDRFVSFTVL